MISCRVYDNDDATFNVGNRSHVGRYLLVHLIFEKILNYRSIVEHFVIEIMYN